MLENSESYGLFLARTTTNEEEVISRENIGKLLDKYIYNSGDMHLSYSLLLVISARQVSVTGGGISIMFPGSTDLVNFTNVAMSPANIIIPNALIMERASGSK